MIDRLLTWYNTDVCIGELANISRSWTDERNHPCLGLALARREGEPRYGIDRALSKHDPPCSEALSRLSPPTEDQSGESPRLAQQQPRQPLRDHPLSMLRHATILRIGEPCYQILHVTGFTPGALAC
ncbi:hypothetical protein Francci3_4021 [Frankia casuarinae]|uniref:Uncharacterized protein n=1 Tax=Frankia casuarinae (strain DSM 45818 / CECT 9043 / HFP020203 / CcI3) TaxID=106370 RepID=Q2J5S1_FRACC|nr:hypothetical protein Francci3_4021 [Frankia casuarinae]